jgi:hypothetical protein
MVAICQGSSFEPLPPANWALAEELIIKKKSAGKIYRIVFIM